MVKLRKVCENEADTAMDIINAAKKYLKSQGIDQWQTGYPDLECIKEDIKNEKGFFVTDNDEILGYLCVDYNGEPAYNNLKGEWKTDEKYVVVHRLAFYDKARDKGISSMVFPLVEKMSREKNIHSFRIDTDADNLKMKHILEKNGFTYRGIIMYDGAEKIAFDKVF